MKIRDGFVSNSSSSSFICTFCAHGGDSGKEFIKCDAGHVLCRAHLPKELNILTIPFEKCPTCLGIELPSDLEFYYNNQRVVKRVVKYECPLCHGIYGSMVDAEKCNLRCLKGSYAYNAWHSGRSLDYINYETNWWGQLDSETYHILRKITIKNNPKLKRVTYYSSLFDITGFTKRGELECGQYTSISMKEYLERYRFTFPEIESKP